MAEIKEDIIDEILDDEDRAKLAELDKKADTKKMADNLEKGEERKTEEKVEKTKTDKNTASATRVAVAALILALCTLGYCYYSTTMHNEKLEELLQKNTSMQYTLNDVKENEDAVNNRFSAIKVSKTADDNTKALLNKAINVDIAPLFVYNSSNYSYCNVPVRITSVSSTKATYEVQFKLTTKDAAGKDVVKNETIVVDELADGATRDYAIFSATDKDCANLKNASIELVSVVKK